MVGRRGPLRSASQPITRETRPSAAPGRPCPGASRRRSPWKSGAAPSTEASRNGRKGPRTPAGRAPGGGRGTRGGRRPRAGPGSSEQWKKRAANARLTLAEGELRFTASDGAKLSFLPGEKATVGGRPLQVDYPLLAGPFLNSAGSGRWTFSFDGVRHQFEAMSPRPAP